MIKPKHGRFFYNFVSVHCIEELCHFQLVGKAGNSASANNFHLVACPKSVVCNSVVVAFAV